MTLDITMNVMMQHYPIYPKDTLINPKKAQVFTPRPLCKDISQASTLALLINPIMYNNVPSTNSPSTTSEFPTMTNQGNEASFGVAIIIAILVIISCITLTVRKLIKRGKRRERQHFSDSVKESILRKQNHKCAQCKRILNVVDWDHKNGDRSNNNESNCQALCPNCHAIKTRTTRQ